MKACTCVLKVYYIYGLKVTGIPIPFASFMSSYCLQDKERVA